MKLKQKNIIQIIIVLFMALYNFILFLSTKDGEKTSVFWISYSFIMLSMVLFLLITFFPLKFTGGTNLVLSLPIYRTMIAYFAIEFFVGTVFMILQKVATEIICFLIQVPILIIFAIIFFTFLLGSRQISNQYEKQKRDVFNLNNLYTSILILSSDAPTPEIKDSMETIAQKIKYSDFNSYTELQDLDMRIKMKVDQLQDSIEDASGAALCLRQLDRLLNERNEMCKYIKKERG